MRPTLRVGAVLLFLLGCDGGGAPTEVDPALVTELRDAALTRPAVDLSGCAFEVTTGAGRPGLPAIADLEIRDAQREVARIWDEGLAVFEAEPSAYDEATGEMVFGPVALGAGIRRGRVRPRTDGGHEIVVEVGDDTSTLTPVLTAVREGGTLELTWDGEASALDGTAGRLVLSSNERASGAWTALVAADWAVGDDRLVSRVVCGREDQAAGTLRYALASLSRDLDGDALEETGELLAARIDGVGGAALFTGRNGRTVGTRQGSAGECWDGDGVRRFATVTDGETTQTEPAGGDATLCPAPFDGGLAALGLPTDLGPTVTELVTRAYDGLHAPLVPEARAQRVLWVGAHPDDEAFYGAPLLGHLCRDLGGSCTLLVATTGGGGSCGLPGGCAPDLATVRAAEMVDAAALYGATLDHWTWTNGGFPGDTAEALSRWTAEVGSEGALIDAFVGVLDTVDPEIVLAVDPVHGGSCHAEHRVVGRLLLRALERTTARPEVLISQGYGLPPRFSDPRLLVFDASQASAATGADAWAFVRLNAAAHPSQIDPGSLGFYDEIPTGLRRVYFLRGEDVALDDPEYLVCPNP